MCFRSAGVDASRGADRRSLSIRLDWLEECERWLIEAGREGVERELVGRLDADSLELEI